MNQINIYQIITIILFDLFWLVVAFSNNDLKAFFLVLIVLTFTIIIKKRFLVKIMPLIFLLLIPLFVIMKKDQFLFFDYKLLIYSCVALINILILEINPDEKRALA